MLKGSIVALITPFKNNTLNEDVFRNLIHYHLKNGTNGVVPGGTTGESPTLSHDEHKKIIEIAIRECNGKIPVMQARVQILPQKQLSFHNLQIKQDRMLY